MVRLRIRDNSAVGAMAHEWDADHYLRFAGAYPAQADGKILLRYPRLFFIAEHG